MHASTPDAGPVLALAADLLFAGRIRGTADALGVSAVVVRTGDELVRRARELAPRSILVDLDARAAEPVAAIRALKGDPALASVPVVAFVAHVHEDLITAARDAGADRVLARSAFVRELPRILRGAD